MADEDRDLDEQFAGIDQPREIPSELAEHLAARLLGSDASPIVHEPASLRDADRPRVVPSAVARRVSDAILATTPTGAARRAVWRTTRAVGVAAVLVVLIGTLAVISRAAPTGDDGGLERAAVEPFGAWPPFSAPAPTTTTTEPTPVVALAEDDPAYARLEPFGSCQELLDWVRPRAEALTDEHGLQGGSQSNGGGGGGGTGGTGGASLGAFSPSAPAGRSGTNVIEPGVDELDVMKITDDALLFLQTSADSFRKAMRVVDTRSGVTSLAATVPLDTAARWLLVHERTAVVLVDRPLATELRYFDVSDPTAPAEVRVESLPGALVDARVIDGTAHLVTVHPPGPFAFTSPTSDDPAEVRRAAAENRRVIRESTIEQWVPAGVPCERVAHPRDGALFWTVSVWSIPVGDPDAATVTGVIANAQALAATSSDLVIATKRAEPAGTSDTTSTTERTHLHRFALEPGGSRYLASGSVPGVLPVPPWWSSGLPPHEASRAISPRGSVIRVATTNDGAGSSSAPGQSQVTVLEDSGTGLLNIVGSVTGLGEAGETIVGTRFVGDIAFVVTFRFTDPLYVIDLSDPKHPRLRGQLKTPGFSSYLHPLAGGRLLGVGLDTEESQTTGVLTIYDVSNLDAPQVAHRLSRKRAFTAAWDPHAFLLWDATRQVVLPIDLGQKPEFEVYRLGPDDEPIHQGTIRHDLAKGYGLAVRSAMIDGRIYTVSQAGVLVSEPETLASQAWAEFPEW